MNHQDLRILRLLEEIARDQVTSQRNMARSLNVSLGLVNSFIKRLAHKGYFKITNIPSNRVKYILTPKGMAEKTRLTYEYIQYSFDFYRQARARLKKILADLAEKDQHRLVFWGQGELAEIAYISLQEIPELEFVALVEKGGSDGKFFGRKVLELEVLTKLDFDYILFTALEPPKEFLNELNLFGIDHEKIIFLITPDKLNKS
jgi:DNA-binding MarR family transcriptional regulator